MDEDHTGRPISHVDPELAMKVLWTKRVRWARKRHETRLQPHTIRDFHHFLAHQCKRLISGQRFMAAYECKYMTKSEDFDKAVWKLSQSGDSIDLSLVHQRLQTERGYKPDDPLPLSVSGQAVNVNMMTRLVLGMSFVESNYKYPFVHTQMPQDRVALKKPPFRVSQQYTEAVRRPCLPLLRQAHPRALDAFTRYRTSYYIASPQQVYQMRPPELAPFRLLDYFDFAKIAEYKDNYTARRPDRNHVQTWNIMIAGFRELHFRQKIEQCILVSPVGYLGFVGLLPKSGSPSAALRELCIGSRTR